MTVTINGSNGLTFNDNSTQATAATGFGFKNRIINGAMVIDQRNAGAAVTPANGGSAYIYTLDRWAAFSTQNSKYSVQQNAGSVTPPAGFTNYIGVTSLAATTPAAGDIAVLKQPIEAFNTADFNLGTANAVTFTVSFWVRSSLTGTFGGSMNNSAVNYVYPFTYTINAANTWEQKTITVSGPTAGSWLTGNSAGLQLFFNLGTGSTYVGGTAGVWSANTFFAPSGTVNVIATNGATFYITGVQLEKGSTATSFDYRPYGTELALCQRYYVKTFPQATAPAQNAGNTGALEVVGQATNTLITVNWMLPVEMRDTPSTVTTYSTNAASANWSTNTQTPTASLGSTGSKLIAVRAGTSLAAGSAYFINVTASAEL